MQNESKGMLLGILGVISFGLTLPTTKYIILHFDPVFIGLGRACIAAVIAVVLLLITKQPIPTKNQFYKLVMIALGVVIGFPVLSTWAMQTVPSSHGGVVLGLLPLATATVGALISNEKPSIGFWIVGTVGSVLVIFYSVFNGASSFHTGDIILFAAIVSAAIGYAVGGQLSKELGGWQVICWALAISLPFILLPMWVHRPADVFNIPINIWLGFLYLALVSQLLGFFLWYKGLALGGIARVSQAQLIQPFITIIASAILLNERLDGVTIIFALLIVGTVAIGKKMPIYKTA